MRALELVEMGEEPGPGRLGLALWTARMRHPTLLFGLVMERMALYGRIDERVDEFVGAGAGERWVAADATSTSRAARSALGFEELLAATWRR